MTLLLFLNVAHAAPISPNARKPLAADSKVRTSTCEVVVNVPQKTIVTEAHVATSSLRAPYFGAGWGWHVIGGFFDSMLSSSRDADAEKAILPIRSALEGVDVTARFQSALEAKAAQMPCPVKLPVQQAMLVGSSELEQRVRSGTDSDLLLVNVVYSMTADSRYLTANAVAILLPASLRGSMTFSDGSRLQNEVAYANRFVYTKKLEEFGDTQALAGVWIANGGEKLKASLNELADGIASLLIADTGPLQTAPAAGANAERFELPVASRQIEVSREADGSLSVITN